MRSGRPTRPTRPGGEALEERLRLMVLTHPRPASGLPLEEVVEAALAAGATALQLRHKGVEGGRLHEEALRLLPLARRHGALFLVNDRIDVALAVGADGAHLGPDDLPLEAARSVVPSGFLLGRSADSPAVARWAARSGADYLGVGAVYGTRSKEGLEGEAVGPERVRRVREASGLPAVGIGGIDPSTAGDVYAAGAGVAVLGAVMHAEDPGGVVRALLAAGAGVRGGFRSPPGG